MKKYLAAFFLILHLFIFAQQKKWQVRFYNEIVNREIFLYADNDEPMPMSAKFDFKLNNLKNTLEAGKIVVVPANTKRFLIAKLNPIKVNAANSFSYSNTFNFGDATQVNYNANYVYDLPLSSGKRHKIYQGYNGNFSHQNDASLDFSLKIGEEVLAARPGTVVETVDHNTQSCPNIACAQYNNRIIVMHEDGTFADYAHLKYKGVVVKKGDKVEKAQLLGYSGNTGYSSGPHLHFSVFLNRLDGKRITIKTKFRTSAGEELLQEGKFYTKDY